MPSATNRNLSVMPQRGDDPVQVDPKHYQVEFENDRVRVLRIRYGPHEQSVMHGHPESVVIFLTDEHAQFTTPDGNTEEHRVRAGQTLFVPAGQHLPHNLSADPYEVVCVELKSGK